MPNSKNQRTRGRNQPSSSINRNSVDKLGSQKSLARDENPFRQGQIARYIYKVETGCVRTFTYLGKTRRLVVAFYFPGDYFGLEIGKKHTVSASAVIASTVLEISKRTLGLRAKSNVSVSEEMLNITKLELHRAYERSLLLHISAASERVGQFLLDMKIRSQTNEIRLVMSRQDIADYLNLTIETVSRAMTKLDSASEISVRATRRIAIHRRVRIAA